MEFEPQTRIEGEIPQVPADFPVSEMWKVISGETKGLTHDGQTTLFDGVGFAIKDFSALRYIRDKIQNTAFYQELDMLANPDDPRDLFGMLQRARGDEK